MFLRHGCPNECKPQIRADSWKCIAEQQCSDVGPILKKEKKDKWAL